MSADRLDRGRFGDLGADVGGSTPRREFLDAIRSVRTSSRLLCGAFQRDLSALLDGEVPDTHARKALAHLEACTDCSEFFQAIRLQALAHRDMAVPGCLATRLRRLNGQDLFEGLTDAEIERRLAKALYELGKAYALLATDGDYLMRVSAEPVEIDAFERGEAADAAVAAKESGAAKVEVAELVESAASYLAKARRLLGEALKLKPRYSEARIYLGFVRQAEGDSGAAASEYREVFLRTDRQMNRVHAAIQLGMLYDHDGEHERALRLYRWVVASGIVESDPDFAFVHYNIAVEHISLGDLDAAVDVLHFIRREHAALWPSVKEWLQGSDEMLARLRADEHVRSALESLEPAFFAA